MKYFTLIEMKNLGINSLEILKKDILSDVYESQTNANRCVWFVDETYSTNSLFDFIVDTPKELNEGDLVIVSAYNKNMGHKLNMKTGSSYARMFEKLNKMAYRLKLRVVVIAEKGFYPTTLKYNADAIIAIDSKLETKIKVVKCRAIEFQLEYIIDKLKFPKSEKELIKDINESHKNYRRDIRALKNLLTPYLGGDRSQIDIREGEGSALYIVDKNGDIYPLNEEHMNLIKNGKFLWDSNNES